MSFDEHALAKLQGGGHVFLRHVSYAYALLPQQTSTAVKQCAR